MDRSNPGETKRAGRRDRAMGLAAWRWGVRGTLAVVALAAVVGAGWLALQGPPGLVAEPAVAQGTVPVSLQQADSLPKAPVALPPNVPPPVRRRDPQTVLVELEVVEKPMTLADGVQYTYWTLNGSVPGPFVRVREGDTVVVKLVNPKESTAPHSIDLHSVTGPGGGSVFTQTAPGQTTAFVWKTLHPGLYVYHCATAPIPMHIANGMYGLILVEPKGGLPPVDREYYVMQQEVYTTGPNGQKGLQDLSWENLLDERPQYVVFNGAVGALTGGNGLKAKVGETVRIYFGVGGPNLTSSFHVIGEVFDRVYNLAALTDSPQTHVQTVLVPPGGAVAVDFKVELPGTFVLVDHALGRLHKGAAAQLVVEGNGDANLYRAVK